MQNTLSIVFNGLGPTNVYHSSKGICKDGTVIELPLDEALVAMNHGYAIEATNNAISKVKKSLEYSDKKRKEVAEKINAKNKGGK